MLLALPSPSTTLKAMLLLPKSEAPVHVTVLIFTLLVMFNQRVPLSSDPYRTSPEASVEESVPVIVCAAVAVTKSERLVPVSALMPTLLTLTVGAEFPARSTTLKTVLEPKTVAPVQVMLVLLTLLVTLVHVPPLSTEP